MKKELAIKECENEIKDFEERGASAKGYLDFYRNEWQKIGSEYREEDIVAIHSAAGLLAPLVPSLVDAVYDKLFMYDATKRHFVPRQSGYDGLVPDNLDSLTLDHKTIQFRKKHLGAYLATLVSDPYDTKLIAYLNFVGKIHTSEAGSAQLDVPLVQMNALMGFVSDALATTILGFDLDQDTMARTLRAFNKLLWLQNDLITRHYQRETRLV